MLPYERDRAAWQSEHRKKVGVLRGRGGTIVDLPGLYSLLPLTEDEGVTARFLMEESPASILNIVDASQLERNLYLTIQLLECGRPMLIGLNMVDVARSRNITVDAALLQRELGVTVVSIVARKGTGCSDILHALGDLAQTKESSFRIDYGPMIESSVTRISERLGQATEASSAHFRWIALPWGTRLCLPTSSLSSFTKAAG